MDINATQLIPSIKASDIFQGLSSLPGITDIILIIKAIGILIVLYIIFLIIKGISQISMVSRLKRIAGNVEEINSKMDLLIKKKGSRK